MEEPSVSIVIPALNESAYLGMTLDAVRTAFTTPAVRGVVIADLLVVDNGSQDETAAVARLHGADVVLEPARGAARARNTGARATSGSLLLFLDADTLVPPSFGAALAEYGNDPRCVGGAFDIDQRPARPVLRLYLLLWRVVGLTLGMARGAAQFCRRDAFETLGGYDEQLYMGEDVDFYWRLKRLARAQGKRADFVREVRVTTSARRFDRWPLWKSLIWTNPVVVALFRHRKESWRGWHHAPPR